jgi:hypothetical protein
VKSPRGTTTPIKKLAAVLSKQNEGLSREERESRLAAIERIADSVRARRSKSAPSQSTVVSQPKSRIHA